jgi:hypothetical protein
MVKKLRRPLGIYEREDLANRKWFSTEFQFMAEDLCAYAIVDEYDD